MSTEMTTLKNPWDLQWSPLRSGGDLLEVLRMRKVCRIRVAGDLFEENVTDAMRDRIFAVMALCPQHAFQVLTKRPERMREYVTGDACWHRIKLASEAISRALKRRIEWMAHRSPDFLNNVWLGVSVENQEAADERLDTLCDLADLGWRTMVSFEPLLSAIAPHARWLALGGRTWAIAGGESGKGPGIRPSHPDWFRSLRDQCAAAGVPFFFKQWGEWIPQIGELHRYEHLPSSTPVTLLAADGHRGQSQTEMTGHVRTGRMFRVGKKAAGDLLDGVRHHAFPEVRNG